MSVAFPSTFGVPGKRTSLLHVRCTEGSRKAHTGGLAAGSAQFKRKIVTRAILSDPWGTWAALSIAGAAGLASEKTKWGRELSGALVATLIGLTLSNVGVTSPAAPQYAVVNSYLLPLAIPLLLFSANLRDVLEDTGELLPAFLLGSVATIVSTLVALTLFPLTSLGENGWKIAAALCARHIGGAINFVAVAAVTGIDGVMVSAALAADNLICALYFTSLYALARNIPPDSDQKQAKSGAPVKEDKTGMSVLEGSMALAVAMMLCHGGQFLAVACGAPGMMIPIVTALTVALATIAPTVLAPLQSSAEAMACIIMQIFFASVGASGSISQVVRSAPALFIFALVQVFVHLGIILCVGQRWPRRTLLLASNANVGGPTTAAGMAAAKGWKSSIVPSILIGTLGYTIATFVALLLGPTFRRMSLGV